MEENNEVQCQVSKETNEVDINETDETILKTEQNYKSEKVDNEANEITEEQNEINEESKPITSKQHHSSSGSSSKSSRTNNDNLSGSGSPRLNSHGGAVTKNSSRSSSSSAGLVHKPQVSTLSSAYDPLEFQLGQQHPPIDAITGVENLNEANFVYGLSHSSSQIISGSPLLDALGDKSSWSSSSWGNKSTDEAGVVRAKKTSWYNALYPSYKSRSEDFKKIFTTLPSNERLIVEYSCAMQKDILIHGRLYATVNYLCFYANIFRWETSVALKWKDVNGLTKEKTALVIPNAIQVTTDTDKHFFTSFAARDKTYMMLFKLWQNALLEQPASSADIWRWVHSVYGDELGLTSEDENDYVSPYVTPEGSGPTSKVTSVCPSPKPASKKLHTAMSVPANLKDASVSVADLKIISPDQFNLSLENNAIEESGCLPQPLNDDIGDVASPGSGLVHSISAPNVEPSYSSKRMGVSKTSKKSRHLSDMSDNTEDSDFDRHVTIGQILGQEFESKISEGGETSRIDLTLEKWRNSVEGRELANEVYPMSVDQLFTLLFTNSKFYMDFHVNRKTFDMNQGPWTPRSENESEKVREVSFTLSLTHPMGPKHSQVIETQLMHQDSQPGRQYIIDVEVANNGIPYADSFYVTVHFYLSKVSDTESRLSVIGNIKYRKTVWGLVKTFIEKNTWSGLEDFYSNLVRAIHAEMLHKGSSKQGRRKSKKRKNGKSMQHQTSTLTSNDNEDDDDDEDVDDIRTNSNVISNHVNHVNTAYYTSNRQTPASGTNANALPAASAYSTISDSLVKVILILLSGLLLANSVLFYKMWDLEAKLGSPLSNLEEVLFEATREHGASMDRTTWLKILQRQEAAHQLELQKWHDLLGTAASLLKQTEASLSNLQKSIHPLAMSKLKGLLDLQEEIVNYKSEGEFRTEQHDDDRGKPMDPDRHRRKNNHEF